MWLPRTVRVVRGGQQGGLQALANRRPFRTPSWEESRWDPGDGPFAFDPFDGRPDDMAVAQL